MIQLVAGVGAVAAAGLAWAWFEAGWVRLRELDVAVDALPPALVGLRIAHLSDFHLGVPSRGTHAVARAVDWVAERKPDLVVISGDLLSRPRGERRLRELLARVPGCFAVLGNHDIGEDVRDPFARASSPRDLDPGVLLRDDARTIEIRGCRVQIVGVDPSSYRGGRARPERLADPDADFRILLSHYPHIVDAVPPGVFDLVLAGHLHDGQIAIPYGCGKIRLAVRRWRYAAGIYRRPGGILHVSPGLGTSFVPFRFFARPEATELVLQSS